MLDQDQIFAGLHEAFVRASIPLTITLTANVRFQDIQGLDSIALVRMILSIEDTFGIEISRREAARLTGIGDIADLIQLKKRSEGCR
jgi:acyl carrier protein